MNKIIIEVQHFHDCPNGPQMIANVKMAIQELSDFVEYRETLVESSEMSLKLGFRGSPTLLINGEDFEGIPSPVSPGLNCRIYPLGLPRSKDIKNKIRNHINHYLKFQKKPALKD